MGYIASHGAGGHDKPCAKCAASAKYAREIDALRTERDAAREVAKAPCKKCAALSAFGLQRSAKYEEEIGALRAELAAAREARCGRCLVLDEKMAHMRGAVLLAQRYLAGVSQSLAAVTSQRAHYATRIACRTDALEQAALAQRTLGQIEAAMFELEWGRLGGRPVGANPWGGYSSEGPTPSPTSNDNGIDAESSRSGSFREVERHLGANQSPSGTGLGDQGGTTNGGSGGPPEPPTVLSTDVAKVEGEDVEEEEKAEEAGPEADGDGEKMKRKKKPKIRSKGALEAKKAAKAAAASEQITKLKGTEVSVGAVSSEGAGPAPAGEGTAPKLFGGRTPRNVLISFYATHNAKFMREPLNVNAVDELLSKYAGREEALFRKLAEKYRVDPAVFGLEAVGKDGGEAPSPTAVATPEPPKPAAAPALQIPNGPDEDGNGGETPSPTAIARAEPPKPAAPALQIPTLAQLGIKDGRLPAGPPPTLQPTAAKPPSPATEAAPTLDSVLAACTPYLTGSSRRYAAWLRDEMDIETPSDLAEAVETCLDDIAEGDGSVGINPMCLYLFEKAVRDAAAKEGEGGPPEALEGKGAMGNGASHRDNPILWSAAAPTQNAVAARESEGEATSPSSVAPTLDSVLASCASYLTGSPLQYAAWLRGEMDIETPSDLAEAVEDCFEEIAEGDGTVGIKLACSYLFQHRVKALV